MENQKELADLSIGSEINHFLLLTKIELKTTKTNKRYLNLELRDKSALLSGKMWENFKEFHTQAKEGMIVKVLGSMGEFMNQLQINIEKIRPASRKDNLDPALFLPKSVRNPEDMIKELKSGIDKISDICLKNLLKAIFTKEKFESFKHVPAGKAWHHAYIHGLLEHTLEIVKICELMCDIHPQLNRNLLITGAILHDLGKTEELKYDTSFDYTDKGRLLGHIVIAALDIENTINSIKDFPADLKNQLLHLILSHQGKLEQASPVEPKTLEAIVLYHADELSAKTNAYKYAIKADRNGESKWTRFLPLANTSLYISEESGTEDDPKETLFDN